MELLDRYLQAVKKHLPWKRQDDIIAELRANLESQLEERESELGRALNKQEAEDWLKGLGHPILVAAKYQTVQYLIGPGLFPMYLYVMRLAMFWAAVVWGVVASLIIPLTTQHAPNVLQGILRMPSVLFSTAAWVTLVFAAMELITKQYPGTIPELDGAATDWKPSALPPLEKKTGIGNSRRSYIKAVAEVVFGFLFLSWLLLVPKFPVIMFGPGASIFLQTSPYTLPPVWWHFYWFALGANALQLTWRYVDLMRGSWQQRTLQHFASKFFGLFAIGLLVAAPGKILVSLKDPLQDVAKYGHQMDQINQAAHMGLLVVMAIVVIQLAWDLGQEGLKKYRRAGTRG